MDSTKLIGVFRGAGVRPNLYRPIANGVYNTNDKLINLYDVRTSQPTTPNFLMFLSASTPPWSHRIYQFSSGGFNASQGPYWKDLFSSGNKSNNHSLTYNGVNSNFYQIQKPFIVQTATSLSLDATKLLTGAIYNLNSSLVALESAYTSNSIPSGSSSTYDSPTQPAFLTSTTSGILLSNACYNKNYLVTGTLFFNISTVNTGATFTLYIYLGDDIKSQVSLGCISGETSKTLFINTVINATVADVGKTINFKIKFTGSTLTLPLLIGCRICLTYTTL